MLFGIPERKLNLKPQAVILHQRVIGHGQVAAEQEHMRPRAGLQIGFHNHHHIQRLRKLFVQHFNLRDARFNPILHTRLAQILCWNGIDIQFGTIFPAWASPLVRTIVRKVQRGIRA